MTESLLERREEKRREEKRFERFFSRRKIPFGKKAERLKKEKNAEKAKFEHKTINYAENFLYFKDIT